MTQEDILPTCKGATRPDRIYISPELRQYFQRAEVHDSFADHSTVTGWFDIPTKLPAQLHWPLPAKIPWSSLDTASWQHTDYQPHDLASWRGTTTSFYAQFGRDYEASLGPHLQHNFAGRLPPSYRGRGQASAPQLRPAQPPRLRPSRSGEALPASDFLGRTHHSWFTQLRRFQSLYHNLQRNSTTPTAIEYRLLTWQAIKEAKGFDGGFTFWWRTRPVQTMGAGTDFSRLLPHIGQLQILRWDFEANYRSFESWSIRQRCSLLKARRQEHIREAFQDVTKAERQPLSTLLLADEATITDVDPRTHHVALDHDLQEDNSGQWLLEDSPARVTRLSPFTYQVDSDLLLCPGQQLRYERVVSDPSELAIHLQQYWSARWNLDHPPDPATWQRVLAFACAYLPRHTFSCPDLAVEAWELGTKKFAARSARGPDGFDHLDLGLMPASFKRQLLQLLTHIESGASWPQQLLKGFIHPLPKHDAATVISHYRPIVVFSMIYRCWGSLRSGCLLQQLSQVLPRGILGFIPGRETGDFWYYTQALLECALQQQLSICGCTTDIRKAFEHIPREVFFQTATALGFPPRVLGAWQAFLQQVQRHFLVQDHLSTEITSNSGFPEGCSLSVVCMCIIDWIWDAYQSAFAPSTIPSSYVDNLELLARDVGSLLRGQLVMEEFYNLWALCLDPEKTYYWATNGKDRSFLRQLGHRVELAHADLGGALTFCRSRALGSLRARLDSLEPLWPKLRRSSSPTAIKQLILRQAFWPKALHAVSISLLPLAEIAQLRTKAVRALGHGKAGAHPGIRLGLLSGNVATDPGAFQLIRVFHDAHRFLNKDRRILDLWQSFHEHFIGSMLSGPFSKLVDQCDLIWWRVESPPVLLDHHGLPVDLLTDPWPSTQARLEDAWRQRLAREVAHRQDYNGLVGLQWPPSRTEAHLTALQHAQVNALREGTFLTGHVQGKFDLVKGTACPHCGADDTLAHRCLVCPTFEAVRTRHSWAVQHWDAFPRSLTERLLPSANPHLRDLQHQLYRQADTLSSNLAPGLQHFDLFTDGSCLAPNRPDIACASWAVVSATHGALLAAAPLGGLFQSIDRAELMAILMATRWLTRFSSRGTIWSDSSYAACGLAALIQDQYAPLPDTHADLWAELTISFFASGELLVQHVPGHAQISDIFADTADWAAYWNDQADAAARGAHRQRPLAFWHVRDLFRQHQQATWDAVDRFRSFQLDIAGAGHLVACEAPGALHPDDPPIVMRTMLDGGDWISGLPPNWAHIWQQSSYARQFGTAFIASFVLWLQQFLREPTVRSVQISWLELAVLTFQARLPHPFPSARYSGECWSDEVSPALAGQLTLAQRIRFIRGVVKAMCQVFSLPGAFLHGIDVSGLRIHMPLQGLAVCIDEPALSNLDRFLLAFTAKRPVRTANDVVRPL